MLDPYKCSREPTAHVSDRKQLDISSSARTRTRLFTAEHRYPSGEHRSVPLRIALPWGILVATRV